MNKIPKNLFCIWIGDESKRPDKWIQTWKDKHPGWNYKIIGNKEFESHKWHNKELIDSYLAEGRYPAVADIMRYQLLYEEGGFCHPADSICLEPLDGLFNDGFEAYAVYENEKVRSGLISPLYASAKGGKLAYELMTGLPKVAPKAKNGKNRAPWQVTGNLYMRTSITMTKASVKVLPSYTFTPVHYTGDIYRGDDKVYACQMWSTTGTWLGTDKDYLEVWQNRDRY